MKIRFAAMSLAGALALASTGVNAALDDKKASEMLNKAGCAACHSLDRKGVGPSYREVAKKRKGDKKALASALKKVREGGSGAFGQIPMPPNPKDKISDGDLKQIVEWILSK